MSFIIKEQSSATVVKEEKDSTDHNNSTKRSISTANPLKKSSLHPTKKLLLQTRDSIKPNDYE